jgi:hypothetical protein
MPSDNQATKADVLSELSDYVQSPDPYVRDLASTTIPTVAALPDGTVVSQSTLPKWEWENLGYLREANSDTWKMKAVCYPPLMGLNWAAEAAAKAAGNHDHPQSSDNGPPNGTTDRESGKATKKRD